MNQKTALEKHIPPEFLKTCLRWWEELDFDLHISRHRKSKNGDYRWHPKLQSHDITVNRTLGPWSFLITYTHEVAHCKANIEFGPRIRHHGKEWKAVFRGMLLELLSTGKIPDSLARPLASYSKNPRASTYSFQPLVLALRKLEGTEGILLHEVEPGNSFTFDGTPFKLISRKRSRALCLNENNGRKYLISLMAEVQPSFILN